MTNIVTNVRPTYGRLNCVQLTAGVMTVIYKVSDNAKYVSVDINVVNTTPNLVKVKIAISKVNPPNPKDYIEYNVKLGEADVLERCGIKCSEDEMIIAIADSDGAVIRVGGYEKVLN